MPFLVREEGPIAFEVVDEPKRESSAGVLPNRSLLTPVPNCELPKIVDGGGPAGVKECVDDGGGPAGVVEACPSRVEKSGLFWKSGVCPPGVDGGLED